MAATSSKKKPVTALVITGIVSIVMYGLLLSKQDLINSTFAKGSWYALLPIITAFLFSFVHGAFTGHFWTVLGIEAAKKKKEVK